MNPLTYIERFLLPATIGQPFVTPDVRLQFALGLIVMAAIGNYGYAMGGGELMRVLRGRMNLHIFDRVSGVLLSGVALALVLSLVTDSF
ncbi:MAG: hypothetical protein ACREWJ_11555 [Rhodoferax sp.]